MKGLVTGPGVVEWVAGLIGAKANPEAVGIGFARRGAIVMGALFENYNGASIHMHVFMLPGQRMAAQWVAAIMDYSFNIAKVKRITGLIAEGNYESRAFAEHLGARCEGVLIDALPTGNLMLYGLLKRDAEKWLTASFQRLLNKGDSDGCSQRRTRQEH